MLRTDKVAKRLMGNMFEVLLRVTNEIEAFSEDPGKKLGEKHQTVLALINEAAVRVMLKAVELELGNKNRQSTAPAGNPEPNNIIRVKPREKARVGSIFKTYIGITRSAYPTCANC